MSAGTTADRFAELMRRREQATGPHDDRAGSPRPRCPEPPRPGRTGRAGCRHAAPP
ncbi:hypothetical protein L083_2616 [Actinoplanes sp. N902-109]|nr:hypothetical protein L083_2616 [Actinoplanes sp. N902-109]